MTWIVKSVKANKSMTTKDPLKDEAWGNQYYGVDDCECIEVIEETQAQRDANKRKSDLMLQIKSKEDGYIYSLMSGDMFDAKTSWADKKKAEWLLLKQELKGL